MRTAAVPCMRFARIMVGAAALAGVLFLAGRAQAQEDELIQAYSPFRAVGIMLDTGQALLWDEKKSEYRLGRVGEEAYGWKIVAIEKEKVVIAQIGGGREELALTPAPTEIRSPAIPKGKQKEQKRLVPIVVTPDEDPKLEPVTTPPPAKVEAKVETKSERHSVKKRDLDRELADFDKLLSTVQVHPASGGGFVIAKLQNAWLQKLGLREGDIVRSVAGEAVSTVEDAARVYARLRTAKTFTIEIERAGARVTIRYDIT